MDSEIIKNILLAEDDPLDVELTLAALQETDLANKVLLTRLRRERRCGNWPKPRLHQDQLCRRIGPCR